MGRSKEINATDLIKPFEAEVEEVSLKKQKKTSPFDFIKSVGETKEDLIKENPDLANDYNSYLTNRGFSYFPDTILYANEMNLYSSIPKVYQYYYYMSSIRKRKRFSKWHKLEKNEDLELVQKVYNVRAEVAKQYLSILSEKDLEALRKSTETGEDNKKNK